MTEETKDLLNDNLDEIMEEFNAILKSKGLGDLSIQNFRVRDNQAQCLEWKYVCNPTTGSCYKKCMKWSQVV